MKIFPSEEALVAAYWRKLARSIDKARVGKRPKLSQSASRRGVRQRFAASKRVRPV
jgi:hypothetical protein